MTTLDTVRDGRLSPLERLLTEGTPRWVAAFALVLALHTGAGIYLLGTAREALDGSPDDAISVELMPEPSEQSDKPDDVAGPKADATNPTGEKTQADDPDPPAPDSAPPTETERKPDTPPPEMTAPPAPAEPAAVLPPETKPVETPPEPKPEEKPPEEKKPEVKEDKAERPTAPSQPSSGSAALLGGGRRPSAAAQATWKGEIGTYLRRHRRYPQQARAQGWQGTARVRVTIDENGHVLGRELVKSTGRLPLDNEALALMQRADPFPKPPTGMPAPIEMTVPVNFSIRQ